jgi:histidyl-tRNA synthetase
MTPHQPAPERLQVLVASIGSGMQAKRMELASRLWEAGIAVSCRSRMAVQAHAKAYCRAAEDAMYACGQCSKTSSLYSIVASLC